AFLLYLSHAIFFKELVQLYGFIDPIYIFCSLSVYPLYYWYIKLLAVESLYKWLNLKLLIPAIVFSSTLFVLYQLMSESERMDYILGFLIKSKTEVTFTRLMTFQKVVYIGSRLVFVTQVIYFLFNGLRLVRNYNKHIANFYSNLESRSILWVNFILYSLVISSVMSIAFTIIGRSFFSEYPFLLLIPSVIFSVLLFFIGLLGYMQNHTVVDLEEEVFSDDLDYTRNNNVEKLNEKLLELFENGAVYKHPDLKITQVSEMLHTNRTYISKHINTHFSCTFNDFVNQYRIKEAKRLLSNESTKNYSLNFISEKSGFGSMGTFMRVFRDIVGVTPGQFRERNQENKRVEVKV
ncbi:MAG TPA: AraC family transcriptional regulator, partial [Draconibacterium sp.]|nr:AraC family transcriptional regulator [Draconibacterium sp.]